MNLFGKSEQVLLHLEGTPYLSGEFTKEIDD